MVFHVFLTTYLMQFCYPKTLPIIYVRRKVKLSTTKIRTKEKSLVQCLKTTRGLGLMQSQCRCLQSPGHINDKTHAENCKTTSTRGGFHILGCYNPNLSATPDGLWEGRECCRRCEGSRQVHWKASTGPVGTPSYQTQMTPYNSHCPLQQLVWSLVVA